MTDGWGGKGQSQGKENRLYTKRYRRWAQNRIELLPKGIQGHLEYEVLYQQLAILSNLIPSLSLIFWVSTDYMVLSCLTNKNLNMNFLSNTFYCIISSFIFHHQHETPIIDCMFMLKVVTQGQTGPLHKIIKVGNNVFSINLPKLLIIEQTHNDIVPNQRTWWHKV